MKLDRDTIEEKYVEIRKILSEMSKECTPTLSGIVRQYDVWKEMRKVNDNEILFLCNMVKQKQHKNSGLELNELESDYAFRSRYTLFQLDMLIRMDGDGIDYHSYIKSCQN